MNSELLKNPALSTKQRTALMDQNGAAQELSPVGKLVTDLLIESNAVGLVEVNSDSFYVFARKRGWSEAGGRLHEAWRAAKTIKFWQAYHDDPDCLHPKLKAYLFGGASENEITAIAERELAEARRKLSEHNHCFDA